MKLVTWNVNGIRSVFKKDFHKTFNELDADIFAIQETRLHDIDKTFEMPGYKMHSFSAEKKGYSGTLVYTKKEPLNVIYGVGVDEFDLEGRLLILEYDNFYLLNSYSPNAQRMLERIDYKIEYNDALYKKMQELSRKKPCILCGDLNVAHQEIDLKNPESNKENAGFSMAERESFSKLLSLGYTDIFRHFYKDKVQYTWWTYRFKARERNIGWRIDYFVTDNNFVKNIKDIKIRDDIFGSDHCPVELYLK